MANPGTGTKFVPVNLNRSYGLSNSNNHHNYPGGSARGRNGGGGSMLVLSRPRSSQKAIGPKLSIPPPLNLPSLRKEHQRRDSSGSGGGPGGGGASGIGNSSPGSSGVGWNKPVAVAVGVVKKESDDGLADSGVVGKGSGAAGSAYVPPSARVLSPGVSGVGAAERVSVLRGEDFPSLQAALPSAASGLEKKSRDGVGQKQKQKQVVSGELEHHGLRDASGSRAVVDMHPHFQSKGNAGRGFGGDGRQKPGFSGGSVGLEKDRKQGDYLPGLLPLVRMNPRSDWEDDERDTRHGLMDRGRDHGFHKSEPYWDGGYDFPRPCVLPLKPSQNVFERQEGLHERGNGRTSSSEVNRTDGNIRDVRTSSREGREGNSWRAPLPVSRDGFGSQDAGNKRDITSVRPSSRNGETIKENKYIPSPFPDNSRDDAGRKDVGYNQGGRKPWSNQQDSFSTRGLEWNARELHGNEHYNRNSGNSYQNNFVSKSSFSSSGGKQLPVYDPIFNFGRDKQVSSKNRSGHLEDPFTKDMWNSDFDGRDPLSVGFVGLVKKKKDVLKQTDFHDPVRESFEAELERVQKMQELERQRIIEEQERAMELPRREEEERMRLAREHEELQRRLEEEAREAAWRAEQENLEAMRRAEEQRVAREEEKHRILMEEERRKQAARAKLLELEERIAKRQGETAKGANNSFGSRDGTIPGIAPEKNLFKASDTVDREDDERMVERITTSASSDSSGMNTAYEAGPKPHFSRDDAPFPSLDRGKAVGSWKRDVLEAANGSTFFSQDKGNSHQSPRWDGSVAGRAFLRREFHGGPGLLSSRPCHKGGISKPHVDVLGQSKSQRWNVSEYGDHYNRSFDVEFQDSLADRYGDSGWGLGGSRENVYPSYHDRMYQGPEADGIYSFGRSRYSMRQPRVLPPPSISSVQRIPDGGGNEQPGSSTSMPFNHGERNESSFQTGYDGNYEESLVQDEVVDMVQQNIETEKLDGSSARCNSQSSFSVSSPPDTPPHLSHDDLDESGDSRVSSAGKGKGEALLGEGGECGVLPSESVRDNVVGSTIVSAGEDEEWTIDHNEELQEQDVYDDDESYEEEDEVHNGEDENVKLVCEFEGMNLEENVSPDMDNLVLCFNEGVEVRMPNDELETSLRNEENTVLPPEVSGNTLEEHVSFDSLCHDGQAVQSVNGSAQLRGGNSSGILLETEKLHNIAITPKTASQTLAISECMDPVDNSNGSVLPSQSKVSYLSSQAVGGPVPSVPSQHEAPPNLQFGLFSGPPLIPSPVPAIQIGSIQMPLHLPSPIGPSVSNVHPSQPPLFHFGQLRYTSPISQGILPLSSQSMPYVQPSVQDLRSQHLDLSHRIVCKDETALPPRESANEALKLQHDSGGISPIDNRGTRPQLGFEAEQSFLEVLKTSPAANSEDQRQPGPGSSQSVSKPRNLKMSNSDSLLSSGRVKRHVMTVKSFSSRSSLDASESSPLDSGGYQERPQRQRNEYQARENLHKKQGGIVSSYSHEVDDRPNIKGRSALQRSAFRRVVSNRQPKQAPDSQVINLQSTSSQGRHEKIDEKESLQKSRNISPSREHIDEPLQSGTVHVFEQPGIEAPTDDDDFIEVRSKRQMLNERREQREKESKAKPRVLKMPKRNRSTPQSTITYANSNKASALAVAESSKSFASNFVPTERCGFGTMETPARSKSTSVSQPLPPIGTLAVKTDASAHDDKRTRQTKSLQTSTLVAGSGRILASDLRYDNGDKLLDNAQTSTGTWGIEPITQQVMALTQTQLDEAMQPAHFGSPSVVVDFNKTNAELSLPSSSILTTDKSFSSTATTNPINSLLAGEKIQFGVVTSPTIFPPASSVSHGIGLPGPRRSAAEDSRPLFPEEEKKSGESCTNLQDCEAEAEAEAAASAVAVAAICSDDNVLANGSISVVDSKCSGDGMAAGVGSGNRQSQARADEPLSVALPADLSVETPPISLWPPLSSPQNSSNPIFPHVPSGPSSPFPFFEMNPLLGGHIFAFGRPDESASSQTQSQKNNANVSGPLGTWQHHSAVDSIYGHPAGFTGPFISPPGTIPGAQGPPHMVVYNHFAPVGQFGQVGLSYMGTTYIPSGKQPDWKHIPASSAMSVGEGDMNSMNISAQRNPANVAAPVQHLSPHSSLLPVASPVPMFDVSPFQTSSDATIRTHWSHVPASPVQSVQASMPMLQQPLAENVFSPFNHRPSVDQPSAASRFSESHPETPSDNSRNIAVTADARVMQLPDERGLVDSSSTNAGTSVQSVVTKSASAGLIPDEGKNDAVQNENRSNISDKKSAFETQLLHKTSTAQQYSSSSGYNYQRGGFSQKNNSGGEWNHRRKGYQGRNQSFGTEKGFSQSKTKQIYVAKQTTSGTSTVS